MWCSAHRRCVAVASILVLGVGLMTACGDKKSDSADQSAAQTTQTTEAAQTDKAAQKTDSSSLSDAGEKKEDRKDKHTIVLEVTSETATVATITAATVDSNGSFGSKQLADQSLPYRETLEVEGGKIFDPTAASLVAVAQDGEDITASIKIDDQEPITQTGTGMFASAGVSGSDIGNKLP